MKDLKVKYRPTGKILADHFIKPLQGTAFWKLRAEIQEIPEDNLDIYLVWDRHENTFIHSQQECAERSDVKMEKRNNESWKGIIVGYIKSWGSNTMVRTIEESSVLRSN